jgi:N-acetylglucosaminyldiphosphoundecaprenol N-acetyl-beta-D-mannosaminyltransferase
VVSARFDERGGKTSLLLGYNVVANDVSGIVIDFIASRRSGRKQWLACLNPHSYCVAKRDGEFRDALRSATWLVPDGIGIVLAARYLRVSVTARITGSDVFEGLSATMNRLGGYKVFFLGSTDDCLAAICDRYQREFPEVRVVGTYSPSFDDTWSQEELMQIRRVINRSGAHVLWVGMTAPKQEKWIADNLALIDVGFAAAIGAVFDFYAGRVNRSSALFRDLGLEWLPRLVRQPRRLWRRTFVSAPKFLWDVVVERFRGRASSSARRGG